ncbi:hypothetical protein Vafri_2043 [Volvox africanus]|nr:hypothetical protein Vafri_2043 [Volvox africanus]
MCGPLGGHPAAAQALLLLDDDDHDDDDEDDDDASGGEDGDSSTRDDTDGEDGRVLRAASVTCHVLGSALNATRQMQTVWRATWPGGHSLRLASYSYLAAAGYPRAVVSALNWCVPLVLDGVADLSELLSEIRLLSFNVTTALIMAEEIFVPQQYGDGASVRRAGGAESVCREEGEEDEEADGLSMDQGSDTALAVKHLVNALRASVAPCPQPHPYPAGYMLRPKLLPWSRLCTTQREQLVDELLTLADLLMIAHAVLLTLRTALSYAADGGIAATVAAAGALRREVAEVQMMRAAASRMLVERMEMQERSSEPSYHNHPYNYRNLQRQNRHGLHNRQSTSYTASKGAVAGQAAARDRDVEDLYSRNDGGAGGALCGEDELHDWLDEGVSWRHVNGLYEHGKTVLQCAADAAAVLLDSEARADDAARCDRLVTALHEDQQLLEGLNALATMPPHYQLPLAPWDPAAAAAAAEAAAAAAAASASGNGDEGAASDPVLQAAMNAAAAAASFSQCNEVLYRLLVLPWDDSVDGAAANGGDSGGDGDVCTSLAEEFERSSWSIPTLMKGDFKPLTQLRVRRLYEEVRGLAAECLGYLRRKTLSYAGQHVTRGDLGGARGDWADCVSAAKFQEDLRQVGSAGDEEEQEQTVKARDNLQHIAVAAAAAAAVVLSSAAVEAGEDEEHGSADGGLKEEVEEVEGLDDPA